MWAANSDTGCPQHIVQRYNQKLYDVENSSLLFVTQWEF